MHGEIDPNELAQVDGIGPQENSMAVEINRFILPNSF
tara:strand:- start:7069 stop:7179 length:111 start_codon:yes stop_codon:yes gene_type:complete